VSESDWLRTGIGAAETDSISVRGRDLATELMGRVTFTELAFLLVQGRMPTEKQTRVLDAVLVSLADHGLTPTVLAARLTYTGAPESLQGAVAAGLLGGGTVFLGVVEDTAAFLGTILEAAGPDCSDEHLRQLADEAVRARIAEGARIPGLGHPIHKVEDPRTGRIYAIAEENGLLGPHLRALREVAAAHRRQSGKALPVNGAGVAGAALADLGFPAGLVRGFALLARTAGLVAHLAEEMAHPLGMPLFLEVDRRAVYDPSASDPERGRGQDTALDQAP
jgi:citrate synthase